MALAGGHADKVGNRYEGRWTVNKMLDVLEGEADSITIEAIGKEGHGAEFHLDIGNKREYHQVKLLHQAGSWSLQAMSKVLEGLWKKIIDDHDKRWVFLSTSHAKSLDELN